MTMTVHHRERQAARGQSRTDRFEYWILVAIAFVICFAMAATSRAVAAFRGTSVDSHGQSVFAGGARICACNRGLRLLGLVVRS